VEFDNITMLQQDALRNKNQLHRNMLDAVQQQLDVSASRRFKLVANLPYCIATPIVSNLLSVDTVPVSMTVTIQKELADRMTARPGTKDYGALSIWIQSQCRVQTVRVIPPSCFWPRPKVDSAIVRIEPDAKLRSQLADPAGFHAFVRSMFLHRRKFLRRVLASAYKQQLSKTDVDEILGQMQWQANIRAEQLSVSEMLLFFGAVGEKLARLGHGESAPM
jgi:16S rRNA (adenine1518-N6/adenine1519-N6)-dimethyltransferase